MRRTIALGLLVLLAATALAAAGTHVRHIAVRQFKPHHGRLLVPRDVAVTVRFSRPVDMATVTPDTVFLETVEGDRIEVVYASGRGGRVVVLQPTEPLAAGTDYMTVVRPGVMSLDGRTIRGERSAYFFTDPRVTGPPVLRPDQFVAIESHMTEGRGGHTASLLDDGRVLLAGGLTDSVSFAVSADLFDPATGTFHSAGAALNDPRTNHVAVRTGSGILLLGGANAAGPLASTEFFAYGGSSFQATARLREERDYTAAVRLKDGRILVTGGLYYFGGRPYYRRTAEIADSFASAWRFTTSAPVAPRAGHTATLLADGTVLLVGGDPASLAPTAEIFDPVTETFTTVVSSPQFARRLHTATTLGASGLVLLADGGSALLQVYDPATSTFYPAGGASSIDRVGATASLLPDGSVLLAGGVENLGDSTKVALDTMDLYRRTGGDHGSVLATGVIFLEPRFGHTATTLDDGRVLFAGGFGSATDESLASAVLFTPDPVPAAK